MLSISLWDQIFLHLINAQDLINNTQCHSFWHIMILTSFHCPLCVFVSLFIILSQRCCKCQSKKKIVDISCAILPFDQSTKTKANKYMYMRMFFASSFVSFNQHSIFDDSSNWFLLIALKLLSTKHSLPCLVCRLAVLCIFQLRLTQTTSAILCLFSVPLSQPSTNHSWKQNATSVCRWLLKPFVFTVCWRRK